MAACGFHRVGTKWLWNLENRRTFGSMTLSVACGLVSLSTRHRMQPLSGRRMNHRSCSHRRKMAIPPLPESYQRNRLRGTSLRIGGNQRGTGLVDGRQISHVYAGRSRLLGTVVDIASLRRSKTFSSRAVAFFERFRQLFTRRTMGGLRIGRIGSAARFTLCLSEVYRRVKRLAPAQASGRFPLPEA